MVETRQITTAHKMEELKAIIYKTGIRSTVLVAEGELSERRNKKKLEVPSDCSCS